MVRSVPELSTEQVQHAVRVCACFNLRRTSRAVTQIYDDALAPLGLSSGQFVLLMSVRLLDEPTLLQLADSVGTDRSVMSRTVRPLEDRGLLAIAAGSDRRTRQVVLTPAGKKALVEGYACWERAQRRMHELLGATQLERLLGVLDLSLQQIQPSVAAKRGAARASGSRARRATTD